MSVIGGANLAWQVGGDARLVRELAEDKDALVLVECRTKDNEPVDVRAILGSDWSVSQNLRNAALSGTAIAIRKRGRIRRRRVTHALRRLVQISRGASDVQARYLRAVPLRDENGPFALMGAHIPIKSTGQQDEALGVVTEVWRATSGRKAIFMDGNGRPSLVAATVTAPHYSGDGVMAWGWSHGWSDARVFWHAMRGSDHKAGTFRA